MTSPLTSRVPTDDMVSASAMAPAPAEVGNDRACPVQPTAISGAVSAVWRRTPLIPVRDTFLDYDTTLRRWSDVTAEYVETQTYKLFGL